MTEGIAQEIAQLTTGRRSLVVMALRGSGGVWGARLGSIAYQVLTHSAAPALARRRLGGRFSARVAKAITGLLSERDRIEIAGIEALLHETSNNIDTYGDSPRRSIAEQGRYCGNI